MNRLANANQLPIRMLLVPPFFKRLCVSPNCGFRTLFRSQTRGHAGRLAEGML
jgi:hypothetical protein